MIKIIRTTILFVLLFNFLNAQDEVTATLQGSEDNQEIKIDSLIKKIETIGYNTVAANKNIQVHYYNKFKEKGVEMISFFDIINKEKIRPLLIENPDFGAYAPFNFLAYKTLDIENDDVTWYGHLAPDTMLDIIGEKDEDLRAQFKDMVKSFDDLVNKEMKPTLTKTFTHSKPLPKQGLTKMVKHFDEVDDLEEFLEEFVMEHDGKFSKHNFIIAGFVDLKFEYEDLDLEFEEYDAYWVSLLCHFEFSNSIFNRGVPQAGIFAPCSVYFYIPEGTTELHVGYASVDNWINALDFKDEERIKYMRDIDAEVIEVFKEMGFELVASSAPMPVTVNDDSLKKIEALKKEVKELKIEREAIIEYIISQENKKGITKKVFKTAKLDIEAPEPEKFSTYLVAQAQELKELTKNLQLAGFEVLATEEFVKNRIVITVTDPELELTNTFLATLNISLNKDSKEIRVQNPSYFGKAYLKDYKYGQFKETLKALQRALGDLYLVEDELNVKDLPDYRFMFGMPHFDDTIEVAKGNGLIRKISSINDYVAYSLKLPNGSTLVGHKLRKRTNTFLSKIEATDNTQLLPYQSLIVGNKAIILDPKYYLALSLPLLSMSDFMKIASAPAEIEKDIERAYK